MKNNKLFIIIIKYTKSKIKRMDNIQKDLKEERASPSLPIENHNILSPNLKFKEIITENNYCEGYNDIFEIFISVKNKEIYLASPNKTDYILDIITIKDNKIFKSLEGHKYYVILVKYFLNNINNKEYLISSDKDNNIIIWDGSNNFSSFYKIVSHNTKGKISSLLLCFNIKDLNIIDDYIIFCYDNKIYTNVYSLNKREKIKYIKKSDEYCTYYLLFWFNQNDYNNYIIELSTGNIFIYNLIKNTLFNILTLGSTNNSKLISGFIYNKDITYFLTVASSSGFITIINLETTNILSCFNVCQNFGNFDTKIIYLTYILQWNDNYIIACEFNNKGFKIIEKDKFENYKIIKSFNCSTFGGIISAKKFIHPILGESLLTAHQDSKIILWSEN